MNARLIIRSWKISLIVILIVAAVVSPTSDIPNMLLFAAPMIVLYIDSIFIAWIFGKKRDKPMPKPLKIQPRPPVPAS